MDQKVTRRGLLCAGLALPLFSGCGSGGGAAGGATGTSGGRGSLALTLNIPAQRSAGKGGPTRAFGGFIPLGTRAVTVSVTDSTTGAALAAPQTITAPFSGTTTAPAIVNVSFTNLPVGGITVSTSAFSDAAAQTPPIATGSATAQIASGQTTNVTVPFVLTLAKFSINPLSVELIPLSPAPGSTEMITAVMLDSSNRPLQYPVTWLSQSPGIATVTFDPANPTVATVTAISNGVSGITAIEPNSGMTVSIGAFIGD